MDINPGDRAENCDGLMEPIGVEIDGIDEYKIHYECQGCGYRHNVRDAEEDNFDKIVELSKNPLGFKITSKTVIKSQHHLHNSNFSGFFPSFLNL